MTIVKNAGAFNRRIQIVREQIVEDSEGFKHTEPVVILDVYAQVKTTKGFTLIANGSDFEKATTNFTIRYPHSLVITRDDIILFNNRRYEIQYVNNIDEANVALELQAKEVTH